MDPEILHRRYRFAGLLRGTTLCNTKISRTARTLLQRVTETNLIKSFKITNKFILLLSVVDSWHFVTDPYYWHSDPFFAFYFLKAHLCQSSKIKKSKKEVAKRRNQGFSYFFACWWKDLYKIMTDPDPGGPNTYGSESTTLLLPQDRTCKQQEKPPALQREHTAFQSYFFSFPQTQLIPERIWIHSESESTTVALIWGSAYMWPFKCAT